MLELRRRERIERDSTAPSLDRFVLGLAIFSALTLFGTLAMLCTVTGLVGLLLFSNLRLQANPVAFVAPPQVVSPLGEPSPTHAPVIDSPLLQPAATPEPTVAVLTPTPEIQPTSELPTPEIPTATPQIPFVNLLTTQLNSFHNALNLLVGMLTNPQMSDGSWQLQVQTQVGILRQNYNEILNVSTPAEFNDLHARTNTAMQICLSAIFTIETAINANDATVLQQSMTDLQNCMPPILSLLNELGTLQSSTPP